LHQVRAAPPCSPALSCSGRINQPTRHLPRIPQLGGERRMTSD
jgi:hypothetical protein